MSAGRHDEAASLMAPASVVGYGTDGTIDRVLRLGHRQKAVPVIFIHAGAGFHSHQNEHVHLEACVAAADMGMRFLKAGATATEAVEASLRILEDKEITNAGYGSNLSIDGTVECDATIVDHLGRSGACGAVPNIRNPISLAKLILDNSNLPLSLRRVPPNALVGEGARLFAEEHGMLTFANDYLVSRNSRDRFFRWQQDLLRAGGRAPGMRLTSPSAGECLPCQYDTASPSEPDKSFPREHTAAIMTGTWNEGQIDSPCAVTPQAESSNMSEAALFSSPLRQQGLSFAAVARSSLRSPAPQMPLSPTTPTQEYDACSTVPARRQLAGQLADGAPLSAQDWGRLDFSTTTEGTPHDDFGVSKGGFVPSPELGEQTKGVPCGALDPAPTAHGLKRSFVAVNAAGGGGGGGGLDGPTARQTQFSVADDEDQVADTIGSIAIDDRGHIAAGSSSGGIGMKHRGRLGPAALVGIGTAVVPRAENDPEGRTVATVTSGTGEHMATTMASQRCAERIFQGTRRDSCGFDVRSDDDDAIMESFIADDFMNHPGVKDCHSAGAIGIMAVKKCGTGYYLYFAHNTDSFALASMGGLEREPRCTMSRLSEGAKIARGGRKIRLD